MKSYEIQRNSNKKKWGSMKCVKFKIDREERSPDSPVVQPPAREPGAGSIPTARSVTPCYVLLCAKCIYVRSNFDSLSRWNLKVLWMDFDICRTCCWWIWDMCWTCSRPVLDLFWTCLWMIVGMFWTCFRHVSGMFRSCFEIVLDMF